LIARCAGRFPTSAENSFVKETLSKFPMETSNIRCSRRNEYSLALEEDEEDEQDVTEKPARAEAENLSRKVEVLTPRDTFKCLMRLLIISSVVSNVSMRVLVSSVLENLAGFGTTTP